MTPPNSFSGRGKPGKLEYVLSAGIGATGVAIMITIVATTLFGHLSFLPIRWRIVVVVLLLIVGAALVLIGCLPFANAGEKK